MRDGCTLAPHSATATAAAAANCPRLNSAKDLIAAVAVCCASCFNHLSNNSPHGPRNKNRLKAHVVPGDSFGWLKILALAKEGKSSFFLNFTMLYCKEKVLQVRGSDVTFSVVALRMKCSDWWVERHFKVVGSNPSAVSLWELSIPICFRKLVKELDSHKMCPGYSAWLIGELECADKNQKPLDQSGLEIYLEEGLGHVWHFCQLCAY